MKINIREQLNNIDRDTFCKYDLLNLYESVNRTTDEKKRIAKALSEGVSPKEISGLLMEDFENDESHLVGYDITQPLIFENIDACVNFLQEVIEA